MKIYVLSIYVGWDATEVRGVYANREEAFAVGKKLREETGWDGFIEEFVMGQTDEKGLAHDSWSIAELVRKGE